MPKYTKSHYIKSVLLRSLLINSIINNAYFLNLLMIIIIPTLQKELLIKYMDQFDVSLSY